MIPTLLVLVVLTCCAVSCAVSVLRVEYADSDWAATRRWKRRNAEQPTTCMCGQPGFVKLYSPYPVRGTVQPFWWRCEKHASVPLTTPWSYGLPMVETGGAWRADPGAAGMARA